jgi:Ca2+-dependent lipid-binding protein
MFSKPDTDESGSVTNIKDVGKFKGIITVQNTEETLIYNVQKKARRQLIVKIIKEVYQKKNN